MLEENWVSRGSVASTIRSGYYSCGVFRQPAFALCRSHKLRIFQNYLGTISIGRVCGYLRQWGRGFRRGEVFVSGRFPENAILTVRNAETMVGPNETLKGADRHRKNRKTVQGQTKPKPKKPRGTVWYSFPAANNGRQRKPFL